MCAESAADLRPAARAIDAAGSLLLVTHVNPDGDGLGSCLALARCARAQGKRAAIHVPGDVPGRYDFLLADEPLTPSDALEAAGDRADRIVVLDTSARAQLPGMEGFLAARRDKVVVLDHHRKPEAIGAIRCVDDSAAAVGVLVLELLDALGWTPDEVSNLALATAITSDTGWMRFSNADGRCLRAVARLFDAGVRPDRLYRRIYQTDRPERVRLLERALAGLELHHGNDVAVMTIRRDDFARTGATEDETENIVNEPFRIGEVELSLIFVENDSDVRVSLRRR